jgi:membrane fusion protein (multidrug efflux system)
MPARALHSLRDALALAVVLAAAAWGLPAASQAPGGQGGEPPPVPVTVVTLHPQDVTLTATLPGRIVASGVAEVRPQVNGIITERLFNEGAHVELGDPLYHIDDAIYEAAVELARAEVAQAKARLIAAEKTESRISDLVGRNVASESALDDAVAQRDAAAAELDVARARLHSAQIDLDRTIIRAPLSGVIGRSLTTQGALVTSGQAEPLAIIRALDPVLVDVTQTAAEIVRWRRGEIAAELAEADPTVTLTLADGIEYKHTGSLTAAEPHVDQQTGVVTLRMEFPNPDSLLLPGMYAQVEMPQGVARDVILAPQEGVSRDRRGNPIALVANAENIVETRELAILQARDSDWIVSDGLEAGDRLIVEGLQKVQPGAKVAPEERASAGTAAVDGPRAAAATP